MTRRPAIGVLWAVSAASGVLLTAPRQTQAQAGPPFMTNDPGTPGNGNWEINLAVAPSVTRDGGAYQVPQVDLNYGLGDRIQLTYEAPYVITTSSGEPQRGGWGNAFPGIKWRFLDLGEDGWNASIFPQIETGGSARAQEHGIASPGPRYLLPLEISKEFGPIDLDFEFGRYIPGHGPRERILGLVAGHEITSRLELDFELYDDRAEHALPQETTLDAGGRYKLRPGVYALFMAGRSVSGSSAERPQFFGYFGVQILLSNYGRTLNTGE